MSVKLLFLVLLLTKLARSRYASLALSLSADLGQRSFPVNESYCAIYNPSFSSLPTRSLADEGSFHQGYYLGDPSVPLADPLGCADVPAEYRKEVVNGTLIVDRGNCTFYRKALAAQGVNASLLLVVYNETMVTDLPDLEPEGDGPLISIPVIFISNGTGEEIKSWLSSSLVYLSVFVPSSPPIDPGSVLLFCIAVGTVLLASFLANIIAPRSQMNCSVGSRPAPKDLGWSRTFRYGFLFRPGMELPPPPREEGGSRKRSVISMLLGLVVMVLSACTLLLLLYFFYSPVVYIVLALYCVVSVFGLYSLISPFMALIPLQDKCRVPPNKIPILKYQPNILFFITVLFCVGVVVWWVMERHSFYAWILQDILGFAFITMLLSHLRFLKVWFVAALMGLLFFYDIFMVFITPYFTHDGISVMEKAATGPGGSSQELLPVVFLVPKLLYPSTLESVCSDYIKSRPASLLGYGDVGIPGLLVTLCYKFDLHFRRKRCFKIYYITCGIAYIVGLAVTYLALTLMQTAQPALLYLVPTTLGSVTFLSLVRKEFKLFFTNKSKHIDAHAQVERSSSRLQSPDKRVPPEMLMQQGWSLQERRTLRGKFILHRTRNRH